MAEKKNNTDETSLFRLVDANLNRLKEGIRVVEDLCRFVYEFKNEASKLKSIRHSARTDYLLKALEHRDIIGDILKTTTADEKRRDDIVSVVIANFKRAEESARALEECLKLIDASEAERFKQIRYALYDVEKSFFEKAKREGCT